MGLEARLRKDSNIEAGTPAALGVVDARWACDAELSSGGIGSFDGRDRVDAIVAYAC